MRCVCGCGAKVRRGQTATNLLAGEVALELVVWDKARSLRSPVAAGEIEELIGQGSPCYQELLAHLHAGREPSAEDLRPVEDWLQRSREARRRIGESLPVVPKKKTKLSDEEMARIDRRHPERTFTGGSGGADARDLESLLVDALREVRAGRAAAAEESLRRFLQA